MDSLDKQILDIIQTRLPSGKPSVCRNWQSGGVDRSRDAGPSARPQGKRSHPTHWREFPIRQIGLAIHAMLRVCPEEKLDEFIAEVNKLPGVTHNYLRAHRQNVWFTFIGPSWEDVQETWLA